MVVALYVVSLGMVIGGLASIYLGSDIIVMERGWTMVIAGSIMAASGAVLAGIATVVTRLVQLEQEFGRVADRLSGQRQPATPAATQTAAPVLSAQGPVAPPQENFADILTHSDLEIAPDSLFAPLPPTPPVSTGSRADIAASVPEPAFRTAEPEPEDPAQVADARGAPTPPGSGEPAGATVVGTYSSGGNFYIMYSDGSIEAETPAGKFRFNSLDELKDFIAAGGDKPKAARPA